jgi:hypothetical protein
VANEQGGAPPEQHELLHQLDGLLRSRIARDPGFAVLCDLLGRWLVGVSASATAAAAAAEVAPPQPAALEAEVAPPAAMPADDAAASPGQPAPATPEQLASLIETYAGRRPTATVGNLPLRHEVAPPRDVLSLEPTARRIELKADACAWAARRADALQPGGVGFEAVRAEFTTLRERASAVQPCYLWMIHHDTSFIDRDDWVRLEGCYRACAEALRTAIEFPDHYAQQPELLRLVGEAQSAIRAAMSACGAHPRWTDDEQEEVFRWCLDEGRERRIYNPFLALNHLADPSLHAGVRARVGTLREDLRQRRLREKRRREALNMIRYHLVRIDDTDCDADHDWSRVVDGVASAIDAGMATSDAQLIDLLAPVADGMPDAVLEQLAPTGVLDHIDRRAAAEESRRQVAAEARAPSIEIQKVRDALRGSRVVLIGGERRQHAKDRLEREFELAELEWASSREHQSTAPFEPLVARRETRLVLLAIRWSSHSYAEVERFCRKYDKVFVRLPGGYNPAQVARQIIEQASAALGIAT